VSYFRATESQTKTGGFHIAVTGHGDGLYLLEKGRILRVVMRDRRAEE
jgi:hypothetical protein